MPPIQKPQKNLGTRIRFFRKRAGISQLDLEAETSMSAGMVSRIETNQVNPNKETIFNIANVLNLNNEEIDYLIGKTALPAVDNEIENAKKEASAELSKKGELAYLLDDRWRFHKFSEPFIKLLDLTSSEVDFIIDKTTAQIILIEDSPFLKRLDKDKYGDNFENLYRDYLPLYFAYQAYKDDDVVFQDTLRLIMTNKISREIWQKLSYKKDRKYASQESRMLYFDIDGDKFPLYYGVQPLFENSRFVIVEYRTKDTFLEGLPNLIP